MASRERTTLNSADDRLRRLTSLCGVATSYVDEGGQCRLVSEHSLSRILAVLGVQAETCEQVRQNLHEILTDRWREMMDSVMVMKGIQLSRSFAVRLPVEADELRRVCLLWRLKQEGGMLLAFFTVLGGIRFLCLVGIVADALVVAVGMALLESGRIERAGLVLEQGKL